ncbi:MULTISPECIES: invasion associated locus B family protein [Bombella]|uniref:Invasion associated locus B family protein n=1 Tax=Bombella pollinis TaxID=2967337 RepID=A0ABT3WMV2_9PROT|nr:MULTISPECIES: invasion associated locus B family protein [Bombella]MCT6855059.1 invasion associated locus B family protein [Bombella apis]MCX5620425.1 invasion associated locus B family protein [Bombella pollinis]
MMMRQLIKYGVFSLLVLGVASVSHAATSLPDKVPFLRETYQDWQLACQAPGGTNKSGEVKCVATQRAIDVHTHKSVMSLRLEPDGEQVRGVVTVSFGLDLLHGLTLTNASQPVGDIYSFSTCLPTGCLVPLTFDDGQWRTLLKDNIGTFTALSFSGQPVKLLFSTRGLEQAMRRARDLTQ